MRVVVNLLSTKRNAPKMVGITGIVITVDIQSSLRVQNFIFAHMRLTGKSVRITPNTKRDFVLFAG
jgi:hypothetical protein